MPAYDPERKSATDFQAGQQLHLLRSLGRRCDRLPHGAWVTLAIAKGRAAGDFRLWSLNTKVRSSSGPIG
jgi:hypothetical protein